MPTPIEAYREGYERGRSDSAGGRLAEVTMGMLRDDPGGHFQKGYSDGAAAKPFNAPSTPAPKRLPTSRLLPKFSENPFGWLFGVLFVSYFWVLWQLIKAPFQLVGSLMRSEKPSPWVIVKNIVLAGLVIFFVWWVPHVNEMRSLVSSGANEGRPSPSMVPAGEQTSEMAKLVGRWQSTEAGDWMRYEFRTDGTYSWSHSRGLHTQGRFSVSPGALTLDAVPQKFRFEGDTFIIEFDDGVNRFARY